MSLCEDLAAQLELVLTAEHTPIYDLRNSGHSSPSAIAYELFRMWMRRTPDLLDHDRHVQLRDVLRHKLNKPDLAEKLESLQAREAASKS